jgi:hypothetical protein
LRHLPEVLQSRKRDRRWKISSSFYDFALRIWISKVLAIFLLKYLILKELLIIIYFQLTREEQHCKSEFTETNVNVCLYKFEICGLYLCKYVLRSFLSDRSTSILKTDICLKLREIHHNLCIHQQDQISRGKGLRLRKNKPQNMQPLPFLAKMTALFFWFKINFAKYILILIRSSIIRKEIAII